MQSDLGLIFDFTKEELEKNKNGFITERQYRRIRSISKIKQVISFCVLVVFIYLSIQSLFWFQANFETPYFEMSLPKTKSGESLGIVFFGILSFASMLLAGLFLYVFMDLTKKLNPNYAKNRVVFLDSKLEEIEYDTNQNQIPYLKVKGIALEHINAYRPGVFLESKIYRFYYHESNLSLLSIDDLSRPENQEF